MKETVIGLEELKSLLDYSCSFPTGVIIGKRWRRNTAFGTGKEPNWVIGEYVDIGSKNEVGVKWTWAVKAPGVPYRGKL